MRITKSMMSRNEDEIRKLQANRECNICPFCGENKSTIYYIQRGDIHNGILTGICKTYATGLFRMKNMKIDCYSCLTCGAEWESEPYEW